jgi:hypothetical protein
MVWILSLCLCVVATKPQEIIFRELSVGNRLGTAFLRGLHIKELKDTRPDRGLNYKGSARDPLRFLLLSGKAYPVEKICVILSVI